MKVPSRIIKQPIVTEKTTDMKDGNWYAFAVDRKANKREIRQAIEDVFNVKVDRVRTLVTPGKPIKRGGRPVGRRSAVKKAYVRLKEGALDFFEGV